MSQYGGMTISTISRLNCELRKRDAIITGRKRELVARYVNGRSNKSFDITNLIRLNMNNETFRCRACALHALSAGLIYVLLKCFVRLFKLLGYAR